MKDRQTVTKQMERVAWAVALLCALILGVVYQQARAASGVAMAADHASAPLSGSSTSVSTAKPVSIAPGSVLGELRIQAIGLQVAVLEDDSNGDLLRGVGHIPGTALPGGLGTVGLAGHRDTFLRPLQNIKPRMSIDVSRGGASYRYVVDSTEIVKPEAVRVLDTQDTPELVLVTCYPFHYIGAAPMRFIVHAHLVSL